MSNVIYRIRNLINNKVYIGQTKDLHKRIIHHKCDVKKGSKLTIHCAMHKYGIENFKFEVIHECDNEDELDKMEIKFITEYDSYHNGYNMTIGGKVLRGKDAPFHGKHHTLETKLLQSKSKLGNLNPNFNKTPSKETRLKISIASKGKHHTLETKLLQSKSKLGNLNPNFNGYYHTPFGMLESSYEIKKYTDKISPSTCRKWCKNSNKIICYNTLSHSKYLQSLTELPLDKTFKELGFWFKQK